MSQVQVWKRAFDRWSPEETNVLIEAWAPRYSCRRQGNKDRAPPHIGGRARSSHSLVTEEWHDVASAVNSYRATAAGLHSCRTRHQCKKRVEYLKGRYMKGQASRSEWPFFSLLHAVLADEVGDRGAPAGDAGGTAAVAAYDGAAADEGGSAVGNADSGTAAVDDFAPSDDKRGVATVDARASVAAAAEASGPAGDASRGAAVERPDGAVVIEGAAAVGDAGGPASVDARGGAFIHEDCRAMVIAVNSSGTADRVSSERAHKQRRGRVKPLSYIYEKKHDAVFGAAAGEERGGACVDGRGAAAEAARRRATFVPPPIPKRPRSTNMAADDGKARVSEPAEATAADLSAQALAAGSVDAVVMMNLAENYKEQTTMLAKLYMQLRMKELDVEREKAAAAHAGAGPRA